MRQFRFLFLFLLAFFPTTFALGITSTLRVEPNPVSGAFICGKADFSDEKTTTSLQLFPCSDEKGHWIKRPEVYDLSSTTTLPAFTSYPGTVRLGSIEIGSRQYACAFFLSKEKSKTPLEMMLISLSQGDLTTATIPVKFAPGATAATFEHWISRDWSSGKNTKLQVSYRPGTTQLDVSLTEYYRGAINLDGKNYEVALVDVDSTGTGLSAGSIIFDEEGKGNFSTQKRIPCNSTIPFNGKRYSYSFRSDPLSFQLENYAEGSGTIKFDIGLAEPWKNKGRIQLTSLGGPMGTYTANATEPMSIAGGEYQQLNVLLSRKDDAGKIFSIAGRIAGPGLRIDDGVTTTIAMSLPKTLELELKEERGNVSLNTRIPPTPGIIYTHIGAWQMPVYEVYPAGKKFGIPISKGEFNSSGGSYPGGIPCSGTWNIPDSVKNGDKVVVVVTWDTGEFFGKLTCEKEITIQTSPFIRPTPDPTPSPEELKLFKKGEKVAGPQTKEEAVYEALFVRAWEFPMHTEAENLRRVIRKERLEEFPTGKSQGRFYISILDKDPSAEMLARLRNRGMNAFPGSEYTKEKPGQRLFIMSPARWKNDKEAEIYLGRSYGYQVTRKETDDLKPESWQVEMKGIIYFD